MVVYLWNTAQLVMSIFDKTYRNLNFKSRYKRSLCSDLEERKCLQGKHEHVLNIKS